LLLLGKAHELTGARDLADDSYLRAFQASKLAGPYGITYADFLIRVGKAKQAEGILKDVLRTTPGYVPAIRMLAQVYLMTGNIAGAQSMVEEARRLKGQGVLADQIQGGVYAATKNFDGSTSSFKRAHEASPSDVQPMLALVRSYLRAGKTKEALSFVDSVVEASPDNNQARLLQGQLEALSGSKEKAANIFRNVIATDPKNPEGYLQLANLMLYDKRLADADKAVSEGLAAIPNDFALRATKAAILVYQEKFDEAIALYEGLLKERPGADVVVNNLASLLSENRQDKESLKRAYELASRLKDSDLPMFKDTVGWASYKVGKYQEAAPFLEAAVNQRPDMALLRYHAGMNQLALGNKDAARKELQKSLELAQNQPFSRKDEATKALQGL
jgi:predicted Zn-dependent protease